jgi:hypothetical protein
VRKISVYFIKNESYLCEITAQGLCALEFHECLPFTEKNVGLVGAQLPPGWSVLGVGLETGI